MYVRMYIHEEPVRRIMRACMHTTIIGIVYVAKLNGVCEFSSLSGGVSGEVEGEAGRKQPEQEEDEANHRGHRPARRAPAGRGATSRGERRRAGRGAGKL